MFKKSLLAGAVAAAMLPGVTTAADSPHTLTGNVGFYSQYIFRGLTQTDREPAIQGGFDYSHANGFYLGTWGSNISWLRDGGSYNAGGSLEWDFYGGYKWGFAPDWTLDLGTLYYWYPGDVTPGCMAGTVGCPKADTWEVYAGLSWKWLSAKFSYSLDKKTFGVPESDGTYYFDLTASYPVPNTKLTLIGHYGIQKYTGQIPGVALDNDTLFSYEDWKIGVSYALPKDFTIGAFYTDTSGANVLGYGSVGEGGVYPRNIAKETFTVFISKTF